MSSQRESAEIRECTVPSFQGADGQKIRQCLGRMLVAAVAGIDHGDHRAHGGNQGRAFLGMAHGADIRVAGDDAHGVSDGLSLGRGRAVRAGKAQNFAT